MIKKVIIACIGILIGIAVGIYFLYFNITPPKHTKQTPKEVIGFLPYWLLQWAKTDYSDDITTLTYFGLRVDGNGNIIKLTTPQEKDPGWLTLSSGKMNPYFTNARENGVKLSLLISSDDTIAINKLLAKPVPHADNLIKDVAPLMKKYHFSDLNLDIEYASSAPGTEKQHFLQFIKEVKQQMTRQKLGTLTIEISPLGVIEQELINTRSVAPYVDHIVLMAYDYHSTVSSVSGPVAPLSGAGKNLEYDVASAVAKALQSVPTNKLILGVPLYGYEWETLNTAIQSAIIPGSGKFASNRRMEELLSSCASCSAFFDIDAKEEYVVYNDQNIGTYHQIYFPTEQSMQAKISFANKEQLEGIALWALGYEGNNILTPLSTYK
jgi:spore germination protein YaaH